MNEQVGKPNEPQEFTGFDPRYGIVIKPELQKIEHLTDINFLIRFLTKKNHVQTKN